MSGAFSVRMGLGREAFGFAPEPAQTIAAGDNPTAPPHRIDFKKLFLRPMGMCSLPCPLLIWLLAIKEFGALPRILLQLIPPRSLAKRICGTGGPARTAA